MLACTWWTISWSQEWFLISFFHASRSQTGSWLSRTTQWNLSRRISMHWLDVDTAHPHASLWLPFNTRLNLQSLVVVVWTGPPCDWLQFDDLKMLDQSWPCPFAAPHAWRLPARNFERLLEFDDLGALRHLELRGFSYWSLGTGDYCGMGNQNGCKISGTCKWTWNMTTVFIMVKSSLT